MVVPADWGWGRSNEFKLGPNAEDEDKSIVANTVPESCQRRRRLPGGLFYQVQLRRWSPRMRRRTQRQRPLPPSREKCPACLRVDKAKMHASEAAEVAAPAPASKLKTKRLMMMNAAAPAAVVSVPPPDKVLPAGGVPCASLPVDEDNEDKNLDFDELEFGIVFDLTDKYGLVCANPEEVQKMIKYVMDHGKEIQIVPPNPEFADKINRIGKHLLRTKKINRYSNDAAAMCPISTTN